MDVDFDVTPGWRIALIAEGSGEKREVWVRSREDEMREAEAGLKQLPCIFLRRGLGVAAAVVIWISSGRNVNSTYITNTYADGEAANQWMRLKRSIFCSCLLRM